MILFVGLLAFSLLLAVVIRVARKRRVAHGKPIPQSPMLLRRFLIIDGVVSMLILLVTGTLRFLPYHDARLVVYLVVWLSAFIFAMRRFRTIW